MDKEEREKHYRYLEKEFKNDGDSYIYYFITQDLEDAKVQGRKSILDYLFEERKDFYMTLFTDIYIRDEKCLFPPLMELWPHLELKAILDCLRIRIPQIEGRKNERLLDLYQHYYNYLVSITLLCKLQNGNLEIKEEHLRPIAPGYMKEIDGAMINGVKDSYVGLISNFLHGGIPKDVDLKKLCIDENEIHISKNFLESEDRNTLQNFENLILGEPVPDLYEGLEYQYKHGVVGVKKNPHEIPMFIQFYLDQINMLMERMEFETAEKLVDLLINDFSDKPQVEHIYLEVKLRTRKLDDVKHYIEEKYKSEEIEKNPYLMFCLCEYEQTEGNIPKAIELIKKAYEISNKQFRYLVDYAKVLLLRDWNEAKKVIKEHIENDRPMEGKEAKQGIMFLIKRFFYKDIEFVKELLDHYEKNFLAEDMVEKNYLHIEYLNLLYKYYNEKEKKAKAKETLDQLLKDHPESETPYRRLLEFHSNKENQEFFNIEKSLEYAKRCAEIRGIPLGYYTGISYLNAENWEKAIDEYNAFIQEIKNVPPSYSRVFMHLFKAYLMIGKKTKACEMAENYIDMYDQSLYLELYKGPTMDSESLLINDLQFFIIIDNVCKRLSKRVQAFISQRKLWLNTIARSVENESLKFEIEKLEKKNRELREKQKELDFSDEKVLNAFLNELENNELARAKLLKNVNNILWENARVNCDEAIINYNNLPEDVQNFLQTAEFLMYINDVDADFSAVILSYTKAFEKMLDDKIGQPFMLRKGKISAVKRSSIIDYRVRNLFPSNKWKVKHHLITSGQWASLIKAKKNGKYNFQDQISIEFSKLVDKKLGDNLPKIGNHASRLANIRNSCAHNVKISKESVEAKMKILRGGVNVVSEVFY